MDYIDASRLVSMAGIADAPSRAQDETPGEEEDQDEAGDDAGETVGGYVARAIVESPETTS